MRSDRHIGGSFFKTGREGLRGYVTGQRGVFCAFLIRRDRYELAGGMADRFDVVVDWDLALRLLRVGDYAYCDEVLALYRDWSTPERSNRVFVHLTDIARLYDTTIAEIVMAYPELRAPAEKGRKARALSAAFGISYLCGRPDFGEAAALVRQIDDGAAVRLVLHLYRFGFSIIVLAAIRAKAFLRQRVKRVLLRIEDRRRKQASEAAQSMHGGSRVDEC